MQRMDRAGAAKKPELRSITGGAADFEDPDLADAVRRGDRRAAAQMYRRLVPAIDRAVIRVFGRRPPDHEDLVQSTLERVVVSIVSGKYTSRSSLRTWTVMIATRTALDALRRYYRQRSVFEPGVELDGLGSSGEAALSARAELRRVRVALSKMTRERATVLFLHDAEGYELAEIAAQLGISVSAAQSRLVRGRKQLIERLRVEAAQEGLTT